MRRTASKKDELSSNFALSLDLLIESDRAGRLDRVRPTPDGFGPLRAPDRNPRAKRAPIDFDNERRPTHFETYTGMGVNGAVFTGRPIIPPRMSAKRSDPGRHPDWWCFFDRAEGQLPQLSSSLLLPLDGGGWVGAAVYPGRIVSFSVNQGHSVGVMYRPPAPYDRPYELAEELAQDLINKMLAGNLTDEYRLDAATKARGGKHVDQMLGVIAAYLYEAVGDRDSIRRIAWFYAIAGQPIPFDVAMLADLRAVRAADGITRADIPAVASLRNLRVAEEVRHPNYFRSTPAIEGVEVAGGFPWLRQGWELLDGCTLPIEPALIPIGKGVASAPFTTLNSEAGEALAELILAERV